MYTYPVLVIITLSLLVGLLCASIAKKKGKNPTTWFGIGTVVSAIMLVVSNEIREIRKRKGGSS